MQENTLVARRSFTLRRFAVHGLASAAAILALALPATGQLATQLNKSVYHPGERIAVTHTFTNATLQAIDYDLNPIVNGVQQDASVWITMTPINLDKPATALNPSVTLNGVTYQMRFLQFRSTTRGGGTIGPGTSRPFGFSAGWGPEVDLTRGLGPTSGGQVELVTVNAGTIVLGTNDRVRLVPGVYKVTHLFTNLEIGGFLYPDPRTTYLSSTQLFTVVAERDGPALR